MKNITQQQTRVLDCIQNHINKTGFPPTRADICNDLGFKSPNAAETHLRALEKKGYITIESGRSRGISIVHKSNQEPINHEFPVIGLVAAGSATLASENIEKKIPCAQNLFSDNFDYFLRVRGLSMIEAGIMEDDLVAIKKTQDIKNGDIVVARIDDEVTLKYFKKENSNKVVLKPANKDYSDIVVESSDADLFIEGKSVGLIRES